MAWTAMVLAELEYWMVYAEIVFVEGLVTYRYLAEESTVTEPTPSLMTKCYPCTEFRFPEFTLKT